MAGSLENARKFLESLQRNDLSKLLAHSEFQIEDDGWFTTTVVILSPSPFAEAISALPDHDRKRIAEAIVSERKVSSAPDDISSRAMTGQSITGGAALLPELILQQEIMISVGTGGARIQDHNDYYIARQARLVEVCAAAGITYGNDHSDLWAWFNFYKQHFASYAQRRKYIRDLFRPVIVAASGRMVGSVAEREPSGWERVDRALAKARKLLDGASAEEDFQAVGLLCREVVISLAQAVYDPAVHVPEDGITPSATDANRMLEAYIRHVFPGESYKEVRAHARAALSLALNVQHRRTATRQLAALCLEAATSTTAVISIISKRTS
jgi:hypothetical protein